MDVVDLQLVEQPAELPVQQLVERRVGQLVQECVLQILHFLIARLHTVRHILSHMDVFQMDQTVT
jgi:hypothetical protein